MIYKKYILLSFLSSQVLSDPFLDDNENSRFYVFAPTTLKETIHDAPAAVSVITAGDIKARGITRIEDIFRFVPGMVVNRGDGNPIRVAYHGTNSENPRRMLIKINGTTIPYSQHFQWIRWEAMPFHIDTIERVEIVRSPSNAIHGGNAAQGYINIVLKDPEISRSVLTAGAGSNGRGEFALRQSVSNNSKNSFYFSLGGRQYDGYDEDFISIEQRRAAFLPADIPQITKLEDENGWEPAHDEHDIAYASLVGSIKWEKSSLGLLAGMYHADYKNRPIVYGNEYVSLIDDRHNNEVDYISKQHFITIDYNYSLSENLSFSGYLNYSENEDDETWVDCRWANVTWWQESYALYDYSIEFANSVFRPTLNQTVDPSSFTAEELQAWAPFANRVRAEGINSSSRDICGNWYQNTKNDRIASQFDVKYFIGDHTKIVFGAGGVSEKVHSDQWYQGSVGEQRINFQANITNYFGPITSNVGFYSQKFSLNNDTYNSPRLALTYKLNDYFSLKAISAISYAEPPVFARQADFEFNLTFADTSYTSDDSGLFFWHLQGNPDIKAERIESHSIVFSGQKKDSPLSFNLNIFQEDMTDVIADLYNWTAFNPSNNGVVKQEGAEVEINYYGEGFSLGATASYIENETNRPLEKSLYAKNIYTFYANRKISSNTNLSFYSNHNNILDIQYDEYNLSLNQSFNIDQLKLDFFIQATYFANEDHLKTFKSSFDLPNEYFAYTSRYDSKHQVFAGFTMRY